MEMTTVFCFICWFHRNKTEMIAVVAMFNYVHSKMTEMPMLFCFFNDFGTIKVRLEGLELDGIQMIKKAKRGSHFCHVPRTPLNIKSKKTQSSLFV